MKRTQYELIARLEKMGFAYDEAMALRRIEKTLQRWGELCCGNIDDYKSWAIERDEETEKPFMVIHPHQGKSYRNPIADRETGALKRLAKIMESHRGFVSFHQTDPRGCALYILKKSDIRQGEDIFAIYNRGIAVCD